MGCLLSRGGHKSGPAPLQTASYQIQRFCLPDAPAALTGQRVAGFLLFARYVPGTESQATFELRQDQTTVFTIKLRDIYNPNGWFTTAPNGRFFTITWSDGGAIGGFHTRVFHVVSPSSVVEQPKAISNVEDDFKARHYCQTRGDNFTAVRWLSAVSLLVQASVYPTSDCGADLGYTERYAVHVPSGTIQRRVSLPRN